MQYSLGEKSGTRKKDTTCRNIFLSQLNAHNSQNLNTMHIQVKFDANNQWVVHAMQTKQYTLTATPATQCHRVQKVQQILTIRTRLYTYAGAYPTKAACFPPVGLAFDTPRPFAKFFLALCRGENIAKN